MKLLTLSLFLIVSMVFELATAGSGVSMFEISTRPWMYDLSKKYGIEINKLKDVPDSEWDSIAKQGYNYVWLMGLFHLGSYGLKHDKTDPGLLNTYKQELNDFILDDVIGSPYAVTDYTINPEIGTKSDIVTLKAKLNAKGLKLMVDFVPNHSAVDCNLTSTNIDYYVRCPKGDQCDTNVYLKNGIAYGGMNGMAWTDTAQFNYWNPDLVSYRIREIISVASISDAIRCDMAYLLLNDEVQTNWGYQLGKWGYQRPSTEFWKIAIQKTKQLHDVIFLAEVYSPFEGKLQELGFDYTYDKVLLDKLRDGNLDNLRGYISSLSIDYLRHSAHFLANHDEDRAASSFGSWQRAAGAATVAMTIPGMRFYWMWQQYGFFSKLDVHLRRENTESKSADCENFYDKLRMITNTVVFNNGNWVYLTVNQYDPNPTAWRLMAWRWDYGKEKRLVVVNFSDTLGEGLVVVSNAEGKGGGDELVIEELFSGVNYTRSANEMRSTGLNCVVNPYQAQIFKY